LVKELRVVLAYEDEWNKIGFHQARDTEQCVLEVDWENLGSILAAVFSIQICELDFHFLRCECLEVYRAESPCRAIRERDTWHCLVIELFERPRGSSDWKRL